MAKQKLIFVVTEDWYFYSHRRPMVAAAQDCGFDVAVITTVDKHRAAIEALGVEVIPFAFARKSLNPFRALGQIGRLKRIYRAEKPALVHHIAMKPILFGSLAAWFAGVPCVVNAFAGLGYLFNASSLLALLLRLGLYLPFFAVLRRRNTWLLFQNKDDLATLQRQGLAVPARARVIRGSGVDINTFAVQPRPPSQDGFSCVYAGRMIGIKGLQTLKEAFEVLKTRAPQVRLKLYGSPDPANPGSWSERDLRLWAESDNVAYEGRAVDMVPVWAAADMAVQASYGGEGVPKSLLEAAACGRPLVATDVPGCREIVKDHVNGFLVPPCDAQALADAIARLANEPELCAEMGAESRKMAEQDFSAEAVRTQTAAFYRACLGLDDND